MFPGFVNNRAVVTIPPNGVSKPHKQMSLTAFQDIYLPLQTLKF